MILEHVVLFRIENFEQGRTGVAAKVRAQLVDFVEQQHRIHGPGFLHHLNDLAGQGADVRTAMAANLGFVTDAAKRKANELSAGGTRDRLAETGLSDSRGANKAKNRSLRIFNQLTNGEIFQNAILYLFQAKMIFVKNFFRLGEIPDLFRFLFPGHTDEPVNIGSRDRAFGRHRRHRLEAVQFLQRFLFSLFGHARFFDLLFQLVQFGALILATQFFMNRFDLLVEVILLLRLLHLALHPCLDRAIKLPFFKLDLQNLDQASQPRLRRKQFQQALFVFDRNSQLR